MTTARRFKDAGSALAEVQDGYNRWTGGLASRSVETAFGVLAAHWAVYKTTDAILGNWLAILSVVIVIAFLGLNLLLTSFMARQYGERCDYADADKARWDQEFEKSATEKSCWPYTPEIEKRGEFLVQMRTWLPIAAAGLFFASLL